MTYIARQEMRHETDIGEYRAFGIAVVKEGIELDYVDDVCNDREEIEELVRHLNENQLDPSHLMCILEDYVIYHSLH